MLRRERGVGGCQQSSVRVPVGLLGVRTDSGFGGVVYVALATDGGGTQFWCVRAGQSSLCSQVLLPLGAYADRHKHPVGPQCQQAMVLSAFPINTVHPPMNLYAPSPRAILKRKKSLCNANMSENSRGRRLLHGHGTFSTSNIGGWRQLAVGGWWWLAVGGGWRLEVGGCWWLAAVGGWQLVAVGGWRLAVAVPGGCL